MDHLLTGLLSPAVKSVRAVQSTITGEDIMKNRVQAGLLVIFLTVLGVLGYNAWLLETTPPERTYTEFLSDVKNRTDGFSSYQGA